MTLEILGVDRSGDLHANVHRVASAFTPTDLAVLRRYVASSATGRVGHSSDGVFTVYLDESDVTELVAALGRHESGECPQPLWPVESCRLCDRDGVRVVDGELLCGSHLSALAHAEDGAA